MLCELQSLLGCCSQKRCQVGTKGAQEQRQSCRRNYSAWLFLTSFFFPACTGCIVLELLCNALLISILCSPFLVLYLSQTLMQGFTFWRWSLPGPEYPPIHDFDQVIALQHIFRWLFLKHSSGCVITLMRAPQWLTHPHLSRLTIWLQLTYVKFYFPVCFLDSFKPNTQCFLDTYFKSLILGLIWIVHCLPLHVTFSFLKNILSYWLGKMCSLE